ncbi:MAG: hypothetical protein Q9213_005819 [Squamulea squamosa]
MTDPTNNIIDPPEGFSMKIVRAGEGKSLISGDLYTATLHALLHFSIQSYENPAQTYRTRGPSPPGVAIVNTMPLGLPAPYTALNCHVAWGLYRSVIAFNNPENVRESQTTVFTGGRRNTIIRFMQAPQVLVTAKAEVENATTSLSYSSASQMVQAKDVGKVTSAILMPDALGYRLHWVIAPDAEALRRETVYDTAAYAMLWTAQYDEDMRFTGLRSISVPGGRTFVRLESYQIGHWVPLTYGFAATVIMTIPAFLEGGPRFQEAFFQVMTPDDRICGTIGIFIRDHRPNHEIVEAPSLEIIDTA